MELQSDFRDLLALFNERRVEYVIVGGYALADLGFGNLDLGESDFTKADHVIQLGLPPVRIDLLTSISGVTWDEAHADRMMTSYSDIAPTPYR